MFRRAGGGPPLNVMEAPPGRAGRRQKARLLDAYAEVGLFAPRAVLAGQRSGNVVLAAADRTISLARLRARAAATDEVLARAGGAVLAEGATVLRDR